MDDVKALQLARDAYSGSTSYFDTNVRPELEQDLRQFQSLHGNRSKYMSDSYRGRAKFYRPKTRAMVRSAEASVAEAFFSTMDVVSITPQDERDPEQQASAEVMQQLLQHRLTKNVPWFKTVVGAFQDAEVQGVVISHQVWDRKKDAPQIELIPRENFRFDPAASWLDPVGTSPYLIWLRPMYVKDVKARMKAGPGETNAKWIAYDDVKIRSAANKWDTTRLLRDGNRTESTGETTAITDFTIVWVHFNVMADTDTGQDVYYYTLGTELLLSRPAPLNEQYAHGRRPFTIGQVVIETHRNDPSGEVRLVRDVQGEINEITNQRIDNVKFAMNKRYFVKRNRQVDLRSLTRNMPGSVTLLTDIETDVKVIDTPDVTSSSYQEQDRLNMDFDEISGNMSQSSVQANRKLNETVGGMEILAGDANKVKAYALKTFIETWVEPTLTQVMLLEQCYETDETVLALAGNKAPMFQKLGSDVSIDELILQEMTLTLTVGMSATSPTQKINNLLTGINGIKTALADGVLERYNVAPSEIIKEVFGALGHKDGGRFFNLEEGADPKDTQIQALQQALDAKHPPELIAAQVEEIKARIAFLKAQTVEKGTTGIYSAMQAAEVIAAVPQVAPVADKIMQAAGYQAPNPVGQDPNFPIAEVGQSAAAAGPMDIPESGNTSPNFPARPTHGIEAEGMQ